MKQFVDAYHDIQAKTLQGTQNVSRSVRKRLITKLRADSTHSTGSGLGAARQLSDATASASASVQSPLSSPQANTLLALPTPSPLALESSTVSSMSSFELPGPGAGNGTGGIERTGDGNVGVGVGVGSVKERQLTMHKSVSAASRVLGGASEGAAEKRARPPPPTSIMSAPTTPTGPTNWPVKELPVAPKWASSNIVRAADELGVHWLTIKNAVYIKRILEVCLCALSSREMIIEAD